MDVKLSRKVPPGVSFYERSHVIVSLATLDIPRKVVRLVAKLLPPRGGAARRKPGER